MSHSKVLPPFKNPSRFGFQVPVGAVIPFAGLTGSSGDHVSNVQAAGWMVCDGSTLDVSQYPELFSALGFQYGGDGSSTFKIPDYRGYFLRMLDMGSGNDPDVSMRELPPGGSGTKLQVGSTQVDAVQTHEHIYMQAQAASTPSDAGVAGIVTTQKALTTGGPTSSLNPPGSVHVSQSETRSKNVYVSYLIKYSYMQGL